MLYGNLRGFGRGAIRRAVREAQTEPPETLTERTRRLFSSRANDAVERFPAYCETVAAHLGRIPGPDEPLASASLPVWTRADQHRLFDARQGSPCPRAHLHATGGSTGVPMRFWMTRESVEWRTAVSDRGYAWAGAAKGVPSVYVWGVPITAPSRGQQFKQGLHHWLQRRWFFNSFQFGDESKAACCQQIERLRPEAIVGYAGNLVDLALFVREHPDQLRWRSTTIVTAAEGLHPGQRELLQEHLGNEVFMSYGSREFMLIGMECREHNGYHLSEDNLYVEVVDDAGAPLPPGETGRILVTDLHNAATPFIRYEIGDLGAMALDEPCPCGLPFRRLLRVDGRAQEVIELADGNRLTALFIPHLMKEFPTVTGYQVAQQAPGQIEVRLRTRVPLDETMKDAIRAALKPYVAGRCDIAFKQVESLEKTPSGKTPIVVS